MIGMGLLRSKRTIPPFTPGTDARSAGACPPRSQAFTTNFSTGSTWCDPQRYAGIMFLKGSRNFPARLMMELCRAYNVAQVALDSRRPASPSINVPVGPAAAVAEVTRCREGKLGHRCLANVVESGRTIR